MIHPTVYDRVVEMRRRFLERTAVMSAAALGESVAQAALAPTFVVSSTKAALLLAAGQPLTPSIVPTHVLTLTQELLKTMCLTKVKLSAAVVLCAGLFAAVIGSSFTSLGIAQDAKPALVLKDSQFVTTTAKAESDEDFIRRISKDLRGYGPTTTEIHFFVASKDAGKRQKLIDSFIEERRAEKEAAARKDVYNRVLGYAAVWLEMEELTPGLGPLQIQIYKELHAAKEKGHDSAGDVAKIAQAHLDRLIAFVNTAPKSRAVPAAMRQIVWVYDFQGKTVEAGAWRDRLKKEYP
jgi:hypothetical protein